MSHLSMAVSAPATATPSAFRATHPDVTVWSAVDFEVYEHLVETATVVLPLPSRIPGAVLKADQIEDAYAERAHQLAAFDQDAYRLAAGGDES